MARARTPNPILGQTPLSTRDGARLNYRTHYFTGQLCVNGHLDWRWTCSGQCRSCQNPPPPVRRFVGVSTFDYTVTMSPKVRLFAQPKDNAEMESLTSMLEAAGREWAYFWGHAKRPVVVPDADEPTY